MSPRSGRRWRVMLWAMEAPLTEDQLRAELRAAGKEALGGFALGVAAGSAVDMTQAIADCAKRFRSAYLCTVRGRAAIVNALAALEEFGGRGPEGGLRSSLPGRRRSRI